MARPTAPRDGASTTTVSKVPSAGAKREADSVVGPTNDRVQVAYQVAV